MHVGVESLNVSGVNMKNIELDFEQLIGIDPANSRLNLKMKPSEFEASSDFLENKYIKEIVGHFYKDKEVDLTSISGKKFLLLLSGKNWKNLDATLDSELFFNNSRSDNDLNLRAKVDSGKGFSGQLKLRENNKKTQVIDISILSGDNDVVITPVN